MRLRLALWVFVIFTLIQWVSGAVFWLYQASTLNRLFDQFLATRAAEVARGIEQYLPDVTGERLRVVASTEALLFQFDRAYVEVFRPDGSPLTPDDSSVFEGMRGEISMASAQRQPVIARFRLRDPDVAHNADGDTGDGRRESGRAAFVGLRTDGRGDYVVGLATSDAFVGRQLALVRRVLLIAGGIGMVAAVVAGWFIGGIAVAPFERLREIASGLRPESVGRALEFDSSNAEVARLTAELDRARQRMMEGFSAQERFLSNVSHEIKTPIAVMLLEAQTLDTDGSPAHVREFVDSVGEEMLRLGRLVESFLTLTRVRDGKGIARIARYGVNDLLIDSAEHCAAMARQYRVALAPRLLSDDATIDTAVAGELELLRTMLDNLVRNAIRFSSPGERVEVRASVEGGLARIAVRDTGPGIPEAQLATIFDRFAQAPEEQRKGRGHGLGLAIAQGIAELHGGRISARNCPGRGCEFVVELPVYGEPVRG